MKRKPNPRGVETVTYEVTGNGPFPFDMLRYDGAWPTHESQTHKFEVPFSAIRSKEAYSEWRNEPRTVSITGIKEPTIERWRTFGWTVSEPIRRNY